MCDWIIILDTFQNGRFLNTANMYINQGTYTYGLQYGNGDIETGPFEVCIYLVNDDIESCGNGYNEEEKEPEFVLVDLGGAYHELIEAPAAPTTSDSSSASSSSSESNNENTNANSQSQTVVVCPAGEKCVIEQ